MKERKREKRNRGVRSDGMGRRKEREGERKWLSVVDGNELFFNRRFFVFLSKA